MRSNVGQLRFVRALINLIICVAEAGYFYVNENLARTWDRNRDIILKGIVLVILRLGISSRFFAHHWY
jgi:hypothetical protein